MISAEAEDWDGYYKPRPNLDNSRYHAKTEYNNCFKIIQYILSLEAF